MRKSPVTSGKDCIKALQRAVKDWQANESKGASGVTQRLLNFWFKEKHLLDEGAVWCKRQAWILVGGIGV